VGGKLKLRLRNALYSGTCRCGCGTPFQEGTKIWSLKWTNTLGRERGAIFLTGHLPLGICQAFLKDPEKLRRLSDFERGIVVDTANKKLGYKAYVVTKKPAMAPKKSLQEMLELLAAQAAAKSQINPNLSPNLLPDPEPPKPKPSVGMPRRKLSF
jgi:hypothetical protein